MTTKWDDLKRLAEAATQGLWVREHQSLYFYQDGCPMHLMNTEEGADVGYHNHYNNLKFAAAANPAAVLELIAQVEQLTSTVNRQHETNRTLHSQLQQKERECEELRKDAQRYRDWREIGLNNFSANPDEFDAEWDKATAMAKEGASNG